MSLNASVSFKTCEKKTSIDPGKIYEEIFSSLQKKVLENLLRILS